MTIRPPVAEHFSSAAPPPPQRSRKNVIAGLIAVLVTAAALADAFYANHLATRAVERAAHAEAARRAADLVHRTQIEHAAAQITALKARMKKLEKRARAVASAPERDARAGIRPLPAPAASP